ncbi:MAG TPA: winged helix DNA-binding protein, partial [Ktedonobacteraceae bacterium]
FRSESNLRKMFDRFHTEKCVEEIGTASDCAVIGEQQCVIMEDVRLDGGAEIRSAGSRSVSTTSRLLDQLVERGLVSRREDELDRRAKRVTCTERGRTLIATLEQRRAESQMAVMDYLSDEEEAVVAKAMALLAEAGKRRRSHAFSESGTTDERSGR